MLNRDNFAITLARTVETFRAAPDDIPAQKAMLRALVALAKIAAVRVTLAGDRLAVDGTPIPLTLPAIPALVAQMQRHGARELAFAREASAADVLGLVRALASASDGGAGLERFDRASAATVTVLSAAAAPSGRAISVTEAFEVAPTLAAADDLDAILAIGGAPRGTRLSDAAHAALRGAGRNVPALIAAAERTRDDERRGAIHRALGRIGTAEAIQALVAAVQPGGRFLGRRSAGRRIPAIDGLLLAGGPAALGTIEGLVNDADRDVRQAAKAALQGLRGMHD